MRSQKRIIMCGTNGTGKSTLAEKIINAGIANEGKSSLAVLPDDAEPIFRPYYEIQESELKYVNQLESKRNKIFFTNKKLWININTYFKNGVLVLDDARFYSDSIDDNLKKVFIRSRQNNVDILFICHGLSEIPPSLITFATHIVLFNTVDSWKRLKEKIPNPDQFEKYVNDIRRKANDHKPSCVIRNDRDAKCNCGAAYVKKVIDVKRDLVQAIQY